jgi:hypothetical protein
MKKVLAPLLLLAAVASAQAQDPVQAAESSESGKGTAAAASLGFFGAGKNPFYAGAELHSAKLSISDSNSFNGLNAATYDSAFWDLRAGYRLLRFIGAEVHYGIADQGDQNPGRYRVNNYYGFFLVPTARVFDLFELGFPIGLTNSSVTVNGDSGSGAAERVRKHLDSLAYGANLEVPLQRYWGALPDIRLTGGATVYYQRSDAREYGYHLGLRYDFAFN